MRSAIATVLVIALSWPSLKAQHPDPRIVTIQVAENVYMLAGNGGNVGVGLSEDGAFIIDDQFAPMVGQIQAAVARLTKEPIRFVINTHWHGDHTGGNERFGKQGAVIVAHDNVHKRMSVEQFMKELNRRVPPAPAAALPVITFREDLTLHWGDDEVEVFHVPHAHTDGDGIVWFRKANVLHMGDVFFHGSYPFVDGSSGGSLQGVIAAVERVLELTDDRTKIIPGHGELTDRKGLQEYRQMLVTVRNRVAALIDVGKTVDEVLAARPAKEWDESMGRGFISPERFVRTVHAHLAAAKPKQVTAAPLARIVVKGSDLTVAMAQNWSAAYGTGPGRRPAIVASGGGSGTGVAALIAGSAHLALTSRPIREPERASAERRGVELREVRVGADALAVVVHKDNPVASLTVEQLARMYRDGGEIDRWSKLRVELDADGDDSIVLLGRPGNSGTQVFFQRAVLGGTGAFRPGVVVMHGGKDVVDLVGTTVTAIGYVGAAYVDRKSNVRVVPIAARGVAAPTLLPPVPPADPSYPLARGLYVCLRADAPAEVRELVDWLLGEEGQRIVREAGYLPVR